MDRLLTINDGNRAISDLDLEWLTRYVWEAMGVRYYAMDVTLCIPQPKEEVILASRFRRVELLRLTSGAYEDFPSIAPTINGSSYRTGEKFGKSPSMAGVNASVCQDGTFSALSPDGRFYIFASEGERPVWHIDVHEISTVRE